MSVFSGRHHIDGGECFNDIPITGKTLESLPYLADCWDLPDGLPINKKFRQELNSAFLSLLLLPDDYIAAFIKCYVPEKFQTLITEKVIDRLNKLSNVIVKNSDFQDYILDPNTEIYLNTFVAHVSHFSTQGKQIPAAEIVDLETQMQKIFNALKKQALKHKNKKHSLKLKAPVTTHEDSSSGAGVDDKESKEEKKPSSLEKADSPKSLAIALVEDKNKRKTIPMDEEDEEAKCKKPKGVTQTITDPAITSERETEGSSEKSRSHSGEPPFEKGIAESLKNFGLHKKTSSSAAEAVTSAMNNSTNTI